MRRSRHLRLALPAAVAVVLAGGLLLAPRGGPSAPDKANGGQGVPTNPRT